MNAERLFAEFERLSEAPDSIPRLRNFVLELGVRGRLCDQDSADDPVSNLMTAIGEQRDRSGCTKGASDEEMGDGELPFPLPIGWTSVRMGWLASKLGAGSTPLGGKSVYQSTGIPFLRSQNVYNDGLRLQDVAYISETVHARMAGTQVHPDDILLNITGASIGRCALVSDAIGNANVSQHVAIIRLFLPAVRTFVHLALTSPFFQDLIRTVEVGVSREGLSMKSLRRLHIPFPPLAEQRRIVGKVDDLMALCDELEAAHLERERLRNVTRKASLNRLTGRAGADRTFADHARLYLNHADGLVTNPEHVDAVRETIRNLAVRGKLMPSEWASRGRTTSRDTNGQPVMFATPWPLVSIGDVAECRLGKMLDKAKNRGRPRRYLRNVNVRWCDFDLTDVKQMLFEDAELDEFALRAGDVLICEGGEPGRAAVWDEREDGIYFQKALHRVRLSPTVDPHFFVLTLRVSADNGTLAQIFTGATFRHLTGAALATYRLPLPPLPEQHRIVARVDQLMAVCDELERGLAGAQNGRARLLEAVLHEALAEGGVDPERLLVSEH